MPRTPLLPFAISLVLLPIAVQAQPVSVQEATPSDPPSRVPDSEPTTRLSFELWARQTYDFRSDLDQVSGRVSVARTAAGFGVGYAPNDQWRFTGSIVGEYSNYDFSSNAEIARPPATDPTRRGDPFDDFYDLSTFLRATRFFENGYSLTLGGYIDASWESDASLSDSITGGGIVGVGYRFADNLHITLGAGVATRLEDDARIVPFIGINWDITETVTLETEGLGLKLTSELNEQFTVGLAGQYQRREYRLNDRHDNENLDDGVLRDARAEVAFLTEWTPTGRISVEARAGMSVWQRYEILNERGSSRGKVNTDPAAFLSLSVGISF